MAPSPPTKVLMLLFPGFNTLDMNGPYETFSKSGQSSLFKVTVTSETEITTSTEGVHVKRDVALDETLIANLAEYKILIVPGGPLRGPTTPVAVQADETTGHFMQLIEAFSKLSPPPGGAPRILLSICTGAYFLGTLGVFNGRFCTTHWAAYDQLAVRVKETAVRTQGQAATVLPARFVDSGINASNVRIISSGGVSCGIDAALYIVKRLCSEQAAILTAQQMDYAWRKTEGVVFGEDYGVAVARE
ncbi:ThiJ/PfpI family protein [Bombardia bombarda]|uniref:ThiJ/PfpI family protein n=1 Tax=Bombardia bombarda TaxID=252184 RepID=A0AA39WGW0_9PEZI|nr:ThiJ/PfpI family protein [Bombardia bombarda]